MSYWGYHTCLDCSGMNPESIRSEENIYNFIKQLVKDIDMVAYGEPQIVRFGHGDKFGITATQLIETSNICIHFVEENNTGYFDIFSCKTYDVNVITSLIKKYFDAQKIRMTYLTRHAN